MGKYSGLAVLLTLLCCAGLMAQTPVVTGNHDTPLRPVTGAGNVGISNAVLRNQQEVRALRVVVGPGGRGSCTRTTT